MHADNKFCGVLTHSTVSNILNILNVKCHCAVTENIHTPPPIEVKVKMSLTIMNIYFCGVYMYL